MKYKIEVRTIWEFGQRKDDAGNPHQEDNLFPAHNRSQPSDRVFILCDGMGGHEAGEVASATVCESMTKSLIPLKPTYTADDISAAVNSAYDALDAIDNGSQGKRKMGTTMTCLVLHEGGAIMAHMGDSRIYHIRPGKEREDTKILFQTRDHSLVNDLIAIGEITQEEAKVHPRKNVITRALQPHMESRQQADIKTSVNVRAGDWFYLCSDGMLEQMDDSAIRFIFSDATGGIEDKVVMLTQATRENRDNHTAFLVHILDVEDPLPISEVMEPAALPPLMGDVEDADSKDSISNDKSTEVGISALGNSRMERTSTEPPVLKIKWLSVVIIAAVSVWAGVFFVKKCLRAEDQPQSVEAEGVDSIKEAEKGSKGDANRGALNAETTKESEKKVQGEGGNITEVVRRGAIKPGTIDEALKVDTSKEGDNDAASIESDLVRECVAQPQN